jgi:3-oxoacyl-[acyl-carrier protein] reductase
LKANSEDLSSAVANFTVGSRGTGRALTEALRDAGASVVVLARDTARLDELQVTSGDLVITMSGDLSSEDDLNAFVDQAVDAFGHIDVVISNAAVGSSSIRKNWSD